VANATPLLVVDLEKIYTHGKTATKKEITDLIRTTETAMLGLHRHRALRRRPIPGAVRSR
jgi:hypothetical protein